MASFGFKPLVLECVVPSVSGLCFEIFSRYRLKKVTETFINDLCMKNI